MGKTQTDEFTDEEIARRRDEVIKRMANTPPKPHKPTKDDATPKKTRRTIVDSRSKEKKSAGKNT
jgi:hypothetical protein